MCTTGGLSWPRRCSRAFRWPSFTTSSSIASSRGSRWERSRDSPMAKRKGMDRRQFVTTTGAAAAAAVLGPTMWVKQQQKTLKIIQWSHFVPAYDAWFDKYAKDWGTAKGVAVTVDHIALADLTTRANAEVAAQEGHDLFQFLAPRSEERRVGKGCGAGGG